MAKKILVAYFSCGGDTERAAVKLAQVTGGELFEIKPKVPYTEADLDWNDQKSRTSVEMRTLTRPEIADTVENMGSYDVVFVGFPIWWYMAPTIINGFLESYDFSGKTVVPFATSGGSDNMVKAETVLKTLCSPETHWLPGKLVNDMTRVDLEEWVKDIIKN